MKRYDFCMSSEPGANVQRMAGRAIAAGVDEAKPDELAAAGYTLYHASRSDCVTHILEGMWEAAVDLQDWKTAHILADAIAALKGRG